jgi:replicative DNA helicase
VSAIPGANGATKQSSSPPAPVTGVAPPHSIEAEEAVLGAVLLSGRAISRLIADEGLRPDHFYRDRHRVIWQVMVTLHDAGETVDLLTLTSRLSATGQLQEVGGKAALDALTGGVPGLGAVRDYARIVTTAWKWRTRLTATYGQQSAIADMDEDTFGAALAEAHAVVAAGLGDGYLGPDVLGNHMLEWLAEDADEGLPVPAELSSLGGMVRLRLGHLLVLGAWPSGGKTALGLSLLAAMGRKGHRAAIWTNEDTAEELVAKYVMSVTGIPSSVISDRKLNDSRMGRVVAEFGRLPFEVQPCHGWTAQQIADHIRQVRPAVAMIDHFHNLSGIGSTPDIDESIRTIAAAAAQAPCLVVLCVQLNRGRLDGVCKPPPVMADLRGSAMFEAAAHTMILVHRDEEEMDDDVRGKMGKAQRLETGGIDVAKNKVTGRIGVFPVRFDESRWRFIEEARSRHEVEDPPRRSAHWQEPGSPEDIGF